MEFLNPFLERTDQRFRNVQTEAEKEYFKRVGERLKYYRLLRGHTNYKFANKFDFPRSTYGKYERGRNITLLILNRILDALEVDYDEFHKGLNKKAIN